MLQPVLPVRRDATLDALRGMAALLVVLFHYTLHTNQFDYGLHVGATGVDLFFLLSGFVIFMTLRRTRTARTFVVSRFVRLYPTYWACVTLTFLVSAGYAAWHHTLAAGYVGRYLGNLTMFQHYLRLLSLDGSYWTMIVEMVFYLIMLVIYQAGQLPNIERVGGGLTLLASAVCIWGPSYFPLGYKVANFLLPLLNQFPLFFAGIVFYLIKHERATLARYALVAGCFGAALLAFPNTVSSSYLAPTEYAAMLTLYFGLLVLYVNGKLTWLANRALVYVGSISYALYLLHQNLSLDYLRPLLVRYLGSNYFWLTNALMLAVMLGLASAVTYRLERPAMRWLKARLLPRPAGQAAAGMG